MVGINYNMCLEKKRQWGNFTSPMGYHCILQYPVKITHVCNDSFMVCAIWVHMCVHVVCVVWCGIDHSGFL